MWFRHDIVLCSCYLAMICRYVQVSFQFVCLLE